MKIKKIKVTNFKAISDQEIDFNGASAIVTGGNNKGKTSLLKGLMDRIRGEKPEVIVKEGEDKGTYTMEMTDGSKLEWRFSNKSESLTFTTKDGFRQTTGVIKAIGEKYFGKRFDIDEFLNMTPKNQQKVLETLVGLDFSGLDAKYQKEFDLRTDANREFKRVAAIDKKKPELVEKPDIEGLKEKLVKVKDKNTKLRDKWSKDNDVHQQGILDFNKSQDEIVTLYGEADDFYSILEEVKHTDSALTRCIDYTKAKKIMDEFPKPQEKKILTTLPDPKYHSLKEIEQQIEDAQEALRKYDAYDRDLQEYEAWVKEGKQARKAQEKADKAVKAIEAEKQKLISNAKLPKEFEFTEDGILYKGLPLSNAQTSSSGKYIAALKLGAMVLGEARVMYFDISLLDRGSLKEIQKWAMDNGLQLLLERPDFEEGDIQYEILEEK